MNASRARHVRLARSRSGSFGLAIRGGLEHNTGIFISRVEPGSEAEILGLKIGDQILRINGLPVQQATHMEVANLIRSSSVVQLRIAEAGFLPIKRRSDSCVTWKQTACSDSRIFINLCGQRQLGCSICRGPADTPGVFVQSTRLSGIARRLGIRPGDQLIRCNGVDLLNVDFADVVRLLKSWQQLDLTVRRSPITAEFFAASSSGYNSHEPSGASSDCGSTSSGSSSNGGRVSHNPPSATSLPSGGVHRNHALRRSPRSGADPANVRQSAIANRAARWSLRKTHALATHWESASQEDLYSACEGLVSLPNKKFSLSSHNLVFDQCVDEQNQSLDQDESIAGTRHNMHRVEGGTFSESNLVSGCADSRRNADSVTSRQPPKPIRNSCDRGEKRHETTRLPNAITERERHTVSSVSEDCSGQDTSDYRLDSVPPAQPHNYRKYTPPPPPAPPPLPPPSSAVTPRIPGTTEEAGRGVEFNSHTNEEKDQDIQETEVRCPPPPLLMSTSTLVPGCRRPLLGTRDEQGPSETDENSNNQHEKLMKEFQQAHKKMFGDREMQQHKENSKLSEEVTERKLVTRSRKKKNAPLPPRCLDSIRTQPSLTSCPVKNVDKSSKQAGRVDAHSSVLIYSTPTLTKLAQDSAACNSTTDQSTSSSGDFDEAATKSTKSWRGISVETQSLDSLSFERPSNAAPIPKPPPAYFEHAPLQESPNDERERHESEDETAQKQVLVSVGQYGGGKLQPRRLPFLKSQTSRVEQDSQRPSQSNRTDNISSDMGLSSMQFRKELTETLSRSKKQQDSAKHHTCPAHDIRNKSASTKQTTTLMDGRHFETSSSASSSNTGGILKQGITRSCQKSISFGNTILIENTSVSIS